MKRFCYILLIFLAICTIADARTYTLERGDNLQAIINLAADGDTLIITPKTLYARPTNFKDPLCGNCLDPTEGAEASYGFLIKDKALIIIGEDRQRTILNTNAGYGIYFENSNGSILRNLTVTGGKRDGDGRATSAGIVVRNSTVLIENVSVINNTNRSDDSAVVVGIGGIFGREGADMTIRNCLIENNGWDGIALYRGANAVITDCVIKDGRGAGIGITWDATALIYRNEVSGFWKGIGAFGTSWVVARNNLVHQNLGWGMIATGKAYMDIANNVIDSNGNCGVAPWSTDSRGRIVNNIICRNGWRDQWVCPCVGVWNYGDWAKWDFAFNIVWDNSEGNYQDIWDQTGLNGNLSVDPLFTDSLIFQPGIGSPALNVGDSTIYNKDGSRSHIGLTGGPQAK